MSGPDSRLTQLFQHAHALDGPGLQRFLEELERESPKVARELRELLEFDARGGALESDARVDPLESRAAEPVSTASAEFVKMLAGLSPPASRYTIQGEVARGGMGAILRVWDETLRRTLAMKVVLGKEDPLTKGPTPPVDERSLGRFLEEAQVTGQLDHPGVVPVHELAVNGEGTVYFTMRLVKGASLSEIFDLVREGKEGWNPTRAVSVILKVCETMSYAHSKGVIHRDLKPANIMVGKYGEVYVMDWGLAKVRGRKDEHDLRLRPASTGSIHSERADQRVASPDSPLFTVDGTVMGTPAFMPPEQAEGRVEQLGPRSDVYGVGAMLYQLLTGEMPYVPLAARLSPHVILAALIGGPPKSIHALNPEVPAELAAICEKAMARRSADRYADMQEMADDLRAYLEHRVVRAYQTGALVELKKWVERNKALAASITACFLAIAVGLVAALVLRAQSERNAVLAMEQTAKASANFTLAEEQRAEAELSAAKALRKSEEVLRLAAFQKLEDLRREADALWPVHPEQIGSYASWTERAGGVVAGLDPDPASGAKGHRAQLEELRRRALPRGDGELFRFASDEDTWWHNQLVKLVAEIEAFANPGTGLFANDAVDREHGWSVPKRLTFARRLREGFADGGEFERTWEEALPRIRVAYPGLELEPQLGLLPIGPDPDSGLWEFAHLPSGEIPARDGSGRLVVKESTCMVLVLLPGNTFHMGSQGTDPDQPNYYREPAPGESPVHDVTLSPFFLSKYEMTQSQWLRSTGKNPSQFVPPQYGARYNRAGQMADLTWPVQSVSWIECNQVLEHLGLSLPTEAQWEYAARGGSTTTWWVGSDPTLLATAANFYDRWAGENGYPGPFFESWDDGNTVPARVGSYLANDFGLHDMHGNVWEWCLDAYDQEFYQHSPAVDPVAAPPNPRDRIYRGGSYNSPAAFGRSSFRSFIAPEVVGPYIGLRPARSLVRGSQAK